MTERYKTNGQTTLAEALDSSETGVDVTSAAALRGSFSAGDTYRIKVDNEIMAVTAEATNTLTVTRGVEGTSAATHSNGATVTQVMTDAAIDQIKKDANLLGISGNSGQSHLTATYTMAGATTVWVDTGLSIALPAAGTYLVIASVLALAYLVSGANTQVDVKLYNSSDSADVTGAEAIAAYSEDAAKGVLTNAQIVIPIIVAAAKTIKLYAKRTFPGADGSLIIGQTTSKWTNIFWVRIA